MKVFSISDLHLSFSTDKPMDIFGWGDHWSEIKKDWAEKVSDDDLVLIAGDISWAMNLREVEADFAEIAGLKGKKVFIKGNHDYWWSSYAKVKSALGEGMYAVQNNALRFENILVCGTRGWAQPNATSSEQDIKIYDRELIRLELTLQEMKKLRKDDDKVILMLHYPPFDASFANSKMTELAESYAVDAVVYGHLHGKDCRSEKIIYKKEIPFYLTSCDKIDNKLIQIF